MTSVLTYSPMTDPFASHSQAHAAAHAQLRLEQQQQQQQQHRYAQSTPPLAVAAAAGARRVTPSGSPRVEEAMPASTSRHRVSIGHGQGYAPPDPVASTSATPAHAYASYSVGQGPLPGLGTSTSISASAKQVTPPARKRASHNPTATLANRSPPKAEHLTDEYVLHPSVYAYKQEHPHRSMVGFGPYVLLRTLGEGEFGKVKLGVHTDYGVEVAIKLIRRGSLDDAQTANKVEREIDVLKTLKHPNIVRMFDVIDTEKYIGIVIEYAAGGELFDYILANRYLRDRDASKLFAQLISGVNYLHQKHIVHRDLKLENLLLDKHRNVIITDFGFANRFDDQDVDLMSTSCGSPCYAAPELVVSEGEYVGSAVDIWSCGVILFAMLAGYLPYDDDPENPDGDNINQLYKYIISTKLNFPPQVSSMAQSLLSIMLVPDPAHRASMADVMAHPWLAGHAHLFERTVEMNEWIFQDQMYKKSQAAKRELNERKRVQRDAQLSTYRVQRSQSTMPGTTMRKHRSAMPGSATTGDLMSGQRTPPLETIAPATMAVAAPALTPNPSDVRSTMAVENESVASSASLPLTAVPTAQEERPQNKNRHTIQVEYDGTATYERYDQSMEREASTDSRIDIPMSATSDVEASGSELGHLDAVPGSPSTPPGSPPAVISSTISAEPGTPRRASPADPTTPRASQQGKLDLHATPRAEATPKGKGKSRDKYDTLPAARSPPPAFVAPTAATAASVSGLPTVPGPKPQRNRKGMSLDKFGLAKLLGSDLPKPLQTSTAVNKPAAPSVASEEKKNKRKTLTLMTRAPSVREKAPPSARSTLHEPSSAPPHMSSHRSPTLASPSVTTVDAIAPSTAGDGRASSSAAKKVMDWFRRKSMAPSPREMPVHAPQTQTQSASALAALKSGARNGSDGSFVRVEREHERERAPVAPSETSSVAPRIEEEDEGEEVKAESKEASSTDVPTSTESADVGEDTLAPSPMPDIKRELAPSPLPQPTRQPLAEADGGNVPRVSPPRATPTRSKSHGVEGPGGVPATSASAPASAPAASAEDYKLRVHTGVLDQSALSSKPPQEVMSEVLRVLMAMGMEVKRENEYKLRCTRAKRRGRFGSVISVIGQRESRPPIPSSPSSTSILSPGGIRGMLRRGSTTPGAVVARSQSGTVSVSHSDALALGLASPAPSSIGTAYSPALPSATFDPIYGEHSVDSGDEVRFNVELCRIKNLPGLYLLSIKRLKGSVWSFKFVYQTVIDRCETLTH